MREHREKVIVQCEHPFPSQKTGYTRPQMKVSPRALSVSYFYRQVSAMDKDVNQPAQGVRADVRVPSLLLEPRISRGKGEGSRNLNALGQVVRSAYHYEWIATSLARASNWSIID